MDTAPFPATKQTISFYRVSDVGRTVNFYGETFGLKKIYERDGKVAILQATAESFVGFVPGELPAGEPRTAALTLIVSDADAWSRRLEARQVPTKGAPVFKPEFGIYVLYVTDPDGYTVETPRNAGARMASSGRHERP